MIVNGTEDIIVGKGAIKFYFDRISSKTKVGLKIKGATHSIFSFGCNNEIVAEIKDFVALILESKENQKELKEITECITLKTYKRKTKGETSFACVLEDVQFFDE